MSLFVIEVLNLHVVHGKLQHLRCYTTFDIVAIYVSKKLQICNFRHAHHLLAQSSDGDVFRPESQ